MSKNHQVGEGWAVVTGASSGLGALFAEKLAERGLPLVLAGRDEARLTEVRQRVQRLAPGVDVELVVGDLGSQAGVEALVAALDGRVDRRPGQQRGLRHLRPVRRDRSRPRPRPDRRQRRRIGPPHPRGAARNAGPRTRPDSQRGVDDRVSAGAVSGDLRSLEGVRAVLQSGVVGRDAGHGRLGDRAVPRADADRLRRRAGRRRVGHGDLPESSRRRNPLWPRDFARSIADARWSSPG